MLTWELGKLNSQGQPFMVSKTLNCSLNEKATFRKWAETMIGRQFTRAEIYGASRFNVKELLGTTCLVQIEQTEKEGKVSAKVTGIVQMPEGMPVPTPVNEFVYFSLDPDEYDAEVFENLSPWAKEKIQASPSHTNLLVALRKKAEPPAPKMTPAEIIQDEIPGMMRSHRFPAGKGSRRPKTNTCGTVWCSPAVFLCPRNNTMPTEDNLTGASDQGAKKVTVMRRRAAMARMARQIHCSCGYAGAPR